MSLRTAYAEAGVDVDAGERVVELLRQRMTGRTVDLLGGLGAFAAAVQIPDGYQRPVLVTATDGVGTKTEIARRLGRLDTIGQDLVAMCANDLVCHGARPAYFLDYVAVGRVDPQRVDALVGGILSACEAIGCALVGGETAEHPGLMEPDAFDLAGFCIGFVERDDLIDGSAARVGDVVVGLESSGLHANGFSLVRRLVDQGKLPLSDELLTPTRLYSPVILDLGRWLAARGHAIRGLAHITGGGLPGNLPRAVGRDLGVRIYPIDWPGLEIFDGIQEATGMGRSEMHATFNCGIGFAIVLEPSAVNEELFRWLHAKQRVMARPIGDVVAADELGGERYAEVG